MSVTIIETSGEWTRDIIGDCGLFGLCLDLRLIYIYIYITTNTIYIIYSTYTSTYIWGCMWLKLEYNYTVNLGD